MYLLRRRIVDNNSNMNKTNKHLKGKARRNLGAEAKLTSSVVLLSGCFQT
jgi:hypothetical protein